MSEAQNLISQLNREIVIAKLDELPTLPAIVYELDRVINDPMSSTNDVEKIMANDQSMTAKVLQLVNSAYYAIPGGVTSLARAIAYLGFDTVNQLVLSASILKALENKGPQVYDMNEFWKHSIGVGIASEAIAKFVSHPTPADLFTCGLIHDMGKVALYTADPQAMLSIVKKAQADQISYAEAETALGLPVHTEIGQWLAQKWKLPPAIQAVITHHHEKDKAARTNLKASLHREVDIVYLANLVIHGLKFGNSGHSKILGAPTEVLERLTIDPDSQFKTLIGEINSHLDKAQEFMRFLGGR